LRTDSAPKDILLVMAYEPMPGSNRHWDDVLSSATLEFHRPVTCGVRRRAPIPVAPRHSECCEKR
jgi:hypothetical protein